MSLELPAALLAGILAAQVAQLGFEARLLAKVVRVESKLAERTEPVK